MPHPRAFQRLVVLIEEGGAFWKHGYGGTAIANLERRTGVNRSSLYHEFGSKRELFDPVLDSYVEDVLEPLLAPMEAEGAGLDAVLGFFSDIKDLLLEEPAGRGCLMVNTVAENS